MRTHMWLISAIALWILAAPGQGNADELQACFNSVNGNLRLQTEAFPDCLRSETPISWGQTGPASIPPVITPSVTCEDAFSWTLSLVITDDLEIAFYAIQLQGSDPALNFVYSVEPGVQLVEYDLTGNAVGRTLLVLAQDTVGNVSKGLVTVPADYCGCQNCDSLVGAR